MRVPSTQRNPHAVTTASNLRTVPGGERGSRVFGLRPTPGLLGVGQPSTSVPARGDSVHLGEDGETEDPAARVGGGGAPRAFVLPVDPHLGPARGEMSWVIVQQQGL